LKQITLYLAHCPTFYMEFHAVPWIPCRVPCRDQDLRFFGTVSSLGSARPCAALLWMPLRSGFLRLPPRIPRCRKPSDDRRDVVPIPWYLE